MRSIFTVLVLNAACIRVVASSTPNASELRQPNYAGNNSTWCVGLNAVGFDLDAKGGRNGAWTVPDKDVIRYFHGQGSNCFRLPVTWERLQSSLGTTDLSLVSKYAEIVDFITIELGDFAIIDPHNNDQGLQFNGVNATRSDFVKLWKAISKQWRNNSHAIFGLYNEPRYGYEAGINGYFDPDAKDYSGTMIEYWRQWMQEAINAVREEGANNLILVPGLHWTTCRDWSGANWWGEALDGYSHAGNTRLAALNDTAMNIAYDVHQYMDDSFTGVQRGCGGHTFAFRKYSPGADGGLEMAIQWAKTYNKKLMMTEIGSWDADDGTGPGCKANMSNYLQRMKDSGVFIGYQVWQFGCPLCEADLWSKRPLNIDWYRISELGAGVRTDAPSAFELRRPNYAGDAGMWCVGLNAVGFDLDAKNGRNGGWNAPNKDSIRYFHGKGSNCFRLPITWERMQSKLGTTELSLVTMYAEIVDFITYELGDFVIIDPHNNDQGLQFDGFDATRSDFVKLWIAISRKWRNNPNVIFGLYNEPRYGHEAGRDGYFDPDSEDSSGIMIEYWRQWMQEAINAIREVGGQNLILVPGLHWTTCRDWNGANWWGEALDGTAHAGNTRLAALNDTAMNIAYDVHQYMDNSFTGESRGCGGHELFQGQYSPGADGGLAMTIQWAKTYNKKLMMTEIGSWDAQDGTDQACKAKMSNYLQMMHDSGVFIGYQVWQFGCPTCEADLWAQRPLNFYWYRLDQFGGVPGARTTTTRTSTSSTITTSTITISTIAISTTSVVTTMSTVTRTPEVVVTTAAGSVSEPVPLSGARTGRLTGCLLLLLSMSCYIG